MMAFFNLSRFDGRWWWLAVKNLSPPWTFLPWKLEKQHHTILFLPNLVISVLKLLRFNGRWQWLFVGSECQLLQYHHQRGIIQQETELICCMRQIQKLIHERAEKDVRRALWGVTNLSVPAQLKFEVVITTSSVSVGHQVSRPSPSSWIVVKADITPLALTFSAVQEEKKMRDGTRLPSACFSIYAIW